MGADHPMPMLLEKPNRAPENLIVASADHLFDLLPIAQEGIGAEQRREPRTAHGADQRHRIWAPPFEGLHDGFQIEQVDARMSAPAEFRSDEAAEREDAVLPPGPLEMLD